MKKEDWYWRGRVARGTNLPREIPDCRVSSQSRLEFYRGWDEENRIRRNHTPEEIETSKRLLAQLRQSLEHLAEE